MSLRAFYVTIRAVIDAYISKINASLASLLDDVNRRYSLGMVSDALFRGSREFILRKGKRIRPLLFVLSYKGYARAKRSSDKKLFISSASIELLHDYMLIHDDVIDNSSLRRGKPTLHKVFDRKIKFARGISVGPQLAIVAGDIIFAIAVEAFLNVDEDAQRKERALRQFVKTAATTGAGEFLDVTFSHRDIDTLTEKDIFLNYTLKTATYTFECPLLMGAILAGADQGELKKLAQLGIAAGQAFQIYDDFLDLFATKEVIGKPVLTDLVESKKTLLVFKAYERLRGKEKSLFKAILEKKSKKVADLEAFRRLITQSGSYDYCLKKMTGLQKKALKIASELKMKKAYKEALAGIIAKLSASRMPFKV